MASVLLLCLISLRTRWGTPDPLSYRFVVSCVKAPSSCTQEEGLVLPDTTVAEYYQRDRTSTFLHLTLENIFPSLSARSIRKFYFPLQSRHDNTYTEGQLFKTKQHGFFFFNLKDFR